MGLWQLSHLPALASCPTSGHPEGRGGHGQVGVGVMSGVWASLMWEVLVPALLFLPTHLLPGQD